jgi:mannose-6-phosphate isomerase-like protein (cupin superfamily)
MTEYRTEFPEVTKHVPHSPKVVEKGWGRELWIDNTDEYCGKILEFNPRGQFSLHFHAKKAETFYVLQGEFELTTLDLEHAVKKTQILYEGDCFRIEPLLPHKLKNITNHKAQIAEFSTHHEDSDSYRIETGDSQRL